MERLKIGISIGDFNGVGLEIILKTLGHKKVLDFCVPILYGSSKVVSYHKNIVGSNLQFQTIKSVDKHFAGKVNIVSCWNENVTITLGKPSEISGKYAIQSLDAAANDLRDGHLDALITAPINKHAMQLAGFSFPGHTEYLTNKFESEESLMFMVSDHLRVGLVTNHLPLGDVTAALTKEKIVRKLKIMNESLKMDFGIERPSIAILGLNPHAGDQGLLGDEEEKLIRPVIIENKKKGMLVMGPFSADAFFGSGQYTKFDGVLAMYHDQGLIPFKALSFGKGVNFTAGLEGVRTSPDHGTAYDLAGKNQAEHSSFMNALFKAIDISRSRKDYLESRKNALVKRDHNFTESKVSEDEVVENQE